MKRYEPAHCPADDAKNEAILLEPQIRYHSQFTANSSIFLFDNGSSNPGVIDTLAQAEQVDRLVLHDFYF